MIRESYFLALKLRDNSFSCFRENDTSSLFDYHKRMRPNDFIYLESFHAPPSPSPLPKKKTQTQTHTHTPRHPSIIKNKIVILFL